MRITGHSGERAPSKRMGVKEERGSNGRVLGKYTEKVGEMTAAAAERV